MVKYYKETNISVKEYAHKRMMNVFGVATPLERVAKYFNYQLHEIKEFETLGYIPDEDEAILIIESITKEKPKDFITEKEQSLDFILSNH